MPGASPEWGFSELPKLFGTGLVNRIQLKIRSEPKALNEAGLVIIDSPGMIDSHSFGSASDRTAMGKFDGGRGYDFKGVVRHLSERADIILLLFDPNVSVSQHSTNDLLL